MGSIRAHISSVNTTDRVICPQSGLRPAQLWRHALVVSRWWGWVMLADVEGNEFCILRRDAELAASA